MHTGSPIPLTPQSAPRRRFLGPASAIAAALTLLALAITVTTLQLRSDLRDQILQRETLRLATNIAASKAAVEKDPDTTEPDNPASILIELQTDRVDVDKAFYYSENLNALPADPVGIPFDRPLAAHERERLAAGAAVASILPTHIPNPKTPARALQLEILTPVRLGTGTNVLGVHLNAEWMISDLQKIDRRLAQQALSVFTLAGAALAAVLFVAFKRLETANRTLAERSRQLLRANQELVLASKTASVGAVASHLIHGLKNPLAALQQLALSQAASEVRSDSWSDAAGATQRMKAMIDDVIRVLRDEAGDTRFSLTTTDLCDSLGSRLRTVASNHHITLDFQNESRAELDNRTANLVLLILENLTTNAIQVSPPGATVSIHAQSLDSSPPSVCFRVQDQGPGIPPERAAQLFVPTQSQKAGGTGLGLALSSQLARHIHATLDLESSSPSGSVFRLTAPLDAPPSPPADPFSQASQAST